MEAESELLRVYELPDYPGDMSGDGDWIDLFLDLTDEHPVGRLWISPKNNGCGTIAAELCNMDHATRVCLQLRDFQHHGLSALQAFDCVKDEYYCTQTETGDLADAKIPAIKRAQGIRLGRPSGLSTAIVTRIAAERRAGASLRAIADGLQQDGVPTAQGGATWHASTVRKVLSGQQATAVHRKGES